MTVLIIVIVVVLALLGFALAARIVKQYEQGVLFQLGRVQGPRDPGFRLIIPFIDVLHRVSLRIVTMPIQSQGIITRDNAATPALPPADNGKLARVAAANGNSAT